MRAVLVLAVLLTHCLGQQLEDDPSFHLAYETETTTQTGNAWWYAKFEILSSMMNPNVNGTTGIYLRATAANLRSQSGTLQLYAAKGARPNPSAKPSPIGTLVGTKSNNGLFTDGELPISAPGVYYVGGRVNCNRCNTEGSAWKLYGLIAHDRTKLPFAITQHPWTFNYTSAFVQPGEFGLAGHLDLPVASSVYTRVHTFFPETSVVMVFSRDAAATALPAAGAETETLKRYPKEGNITGSYSTGPLVLGQGRWFVSPYLLHAASAKPPEFKWALAVGTEPEPGYSAAFLRTANNSVLVMAVTLLALLLARWV